jgi:hypothetical protein
MPLTKIIEEFSLPEPTHLFIDTYGSEQTVILGMRKLLSRGQIGCVMVQIQEQGLSLKGSTSYRVLTEEGYSIAWSEEHEAESFIPGYANCVFVI